MHDNTVNKPGGRKLWVIPGGHIPLHTNGPEPEFTSRDTLSILNCCEQMVIIQITIFYAHREPAGPYFLTLAPKRACHTWFNDFIFPEALPLDTDYAAVVSADSPIIVQFSRQDTGSAANALAGSMAFYADE